MKAVLGLGSNLGSPGFYLKQAIKHIKNAGVDILAYSSVYRSDAQLTEDAPAEWNLPFLNAAILIDTILTTDALLTLIKKIETQMGRDPDHAKWSPREIDIDILLTDSLPIAQPHLMIPHKELFNRYFALAPLLEIYPLDKDAEITCQQLTPSQKIHLKLDGPLMMGICNLTYDSYTEIGNGNKSIKSSFDQIKNLVIDGADIIDIGAESTRPGAEVVSTDTEIQLINDMLDYIQQHRDQLLYMPLISIDTRKLEVMQTILKEHPWIWMINDVEGSQLKEKALLLQNYNINYVLTHNLGVTGRHTQLHKTEVTQHICDFFTDKSTQLKDCGFDLNKLYLDVGFGFGKHADAAQQIITDLGHIKQTLNLPLLIGHSRKPSVLGLPKDASLAALDLATQRLSVKLRKQGADILRVHCIE